MIKLWLLISNPLMFEFLTVRASNSAATINKSGEMLNPCLMPLSILNLEQVPSDRETRHKPIVFN